MKILLLYPPVTDPTSPYISVPYLKGFINSLGIEAQQLDLNVMAASWFLNEENLTPIVEKACDRFKDLNQKRFLDHQEKLEYSNLLYALEKAEYLLKNARLAADFMRTKSTGFFNPKEYTKHFTVIDDVMQLISSAYYPLSMSFSNYRSPFLMLNSGEIRTSAMPENNPFYGFFDSVAAEKINTIKPDLIGISIVFPSQLQPAYSLAWYIKDHFDIPLISGGPAITQLFVRQDKNNIEHLLNPFNASLIFEAEQSLKLLLKNFPAKLPCGVIAGEIQRDLAGLPAPDFDGLDLNFYLSRDIVLPYDPSRGCYWGKCSFCHYGLSACGTTEYRQRPVNEIISHLVSLKSRYNNALFYFSQDTMSIPLALKIAGELEDKNIYWATDIRPESNLTEDTAAALKQGGALAFSFGVESGSPRVLESINKGINVKDAGNALSNSKKAGIAVEAMCFTGFPGETTKEALMTLAFLDKHKDDISLFICGGFYLVSGSFVARNPKRFNISEIFKVKGDQFETGLFFIEEPKDDAVIEDDELFEKRFEALSGHWFLNQYPWAGSLSTSHTLLWYKEKGIDCFRKTGRIHTRPVKTNLKYTGKPMHNLDEESIYSFENQIWQKMIYHDREVSRNLYAQYSSNAGKVKKKRFS